MDGEVITVEHVLVCRSPMSPVLMIVSKDTSEGRIFYTVKVLEASMPKKFGPPTTSVSCIYCTMTGLVRDTSPAVAKPPPPPPPPLQGGRESQTDVSRLVRNTSQAVPKEPPPHLQRGMVSQTASTPPPSPPHLQGGMESQKGSSPTPPPPHLQAGMESRTEVTSPVHDTSQAVPKAPPPHLQNDMESDW